MVSIGDFLKGDVKVRGRMLYLVSCVVRMLKMDNKPGKRSDKVRGTILVYNIFQTNTVL